MARPAPVGANSFAPTGAGLSDHTAADTAIQSTHLRVVRRIHADEGTLRARRINALLQLWSRVYYAGGATPPLLPCLAVTPDLASRHKWRGLRSGRGEFIRLAQDLQTTPAADTTIRA